MADHAAAGEGAKQAKGERTPKGERRRNALIDAAAELLVDGGFDAVRHRAVAERAGLPLASTTYYFSSLEDLVAAAVEQHGRTELATGRARFEALDEQRRDLDAMADLVLDQLLGPRQADAETDYEAVLLRYERLVATGRRPMLRPLMRELGAEMDALLHDVFAESGFTVDRAQVDRLVALVDGVVVNALIESDPHPRDAACRALLAELKAVAK
jgi:DNA-binding transcriptional regulator YbjK